MTLLITGGGGFVMSNLARMWLEKHREDGWCSRCRIELGRVRAGRGSGRR